MFNADNPNEKKEMARRQREALEQKELLEERLAIQQESSCEENLPLAKEIPPAAKKLLERFKAELYNLEKK